MEPSAPLPEAEDLGEIVGVARPQRDVLPRTVGPHPGAVDLRRGETARGFGKSRRDPLRHYEVSESVGALRFIKNDGPQIENQTSVAPHRPAEPS